MGDNYWDAIPQGTRDLVQKRLEERLRRHPYEKTEAITNYQRLTFCDIMDYAQIITKNWPAFEPVFGSRGEVERHFLNLKEYRNALKHAREMNSVEKKQGEASVEWLFSVLASKRQALSEESILAAGEAADDQGAENGNGAVEKNAPTSVDELLAKTKDRQTLGRIKEMMVCCEALPNVERYTTTDHIVYRTSRVFATIYPQQYQFWVDVLRKGVDDRHHLLKHKHPVFGHIEIPNDLDLDQVKELVRQSHNWTTAQLALGAS